MLLERLKSDFRFALVTLFSVLTLLVVAPIGVYRATLGQTLAALVDLGVVLAIGGCVAYVWRGGEIDRAALFTAVAYGLGCIMIAHLVGLPGVLWMYPVIVANYLLLHPRQAIATSAFVVIGVATVSDALPGMLDRVLVVITGIVVSLFAYLFARRTESQRVQLELLVTRDPLTSAFNRRAMEQELPVAIEASRRTGAPAGIAVIDLDHFKCINDTYGHEAGDRVLVDFVRILTGATRRGDRLFRYGGEEFVLLLPGLDTAALVDLANVLRTRVAAGLEVDGQPITVSIGAATLAPADTAHTWLARADAAMYRAKRDGRDRVVLAPMPPTATVVPLTRRPTPRER